MTGWLSNMWPSTVEKQQQQFCQKELPALWDSWVAHFTEFGFAGSATARHVPSREFAALPTSVPAAERVIAIGDLHGDFRKTWRAFRLAGLIDERGRWSGGSAVCVQVGDVLDRGDQELQIFYFLERLQVEADAHGGKLYVLNGNHETMNVSTNHRYATPGAGLELLRWQQWTALASRLREQCSSCTKTPGPPPPLGSGSGRGGGGGAAPAAASGGQNTLYGGMHSDRTAAWRPGSPLSARFLAPHQISLQVGSNLFVHGGVLPSHVDYGLERINKETQSWLLEGQALQPPNFLRGSTAIVWARDYSAEDEGRCDCDKLKQVLKSVPGAQRMIVGHTIQEQGVNSACGGRVVRVDVGLSRGCGDGAPQVLEILGDSVVRRLREGAAPEVMPSGAEGAAAGDAAGRKGGAPPAAAPQPASVWRWFSGGGGSSSGGTPVASPA
ncbi:hypothetical protein FOA52_001717 [Chlamydomonas sp. UWO 241]|nr:hypothetical protein FOA52_001717 [Chlamydomonas sp. UWO 241]